MNPSNSASQCSFSSAAEGLLIRSALYREFYAEREEIMRHKWLESEKVGQDIGFERALVNWVMHHRANWRAARRNRATDLSSDSSNVILSTPRD